MTSGWSWYIIILTLLNVFGMVWLIWWSGKGSSAQVAKGQTTGHVWDGDLQDFNNPLPRWWLWLFYITIVFGLVYLALYPGLGKAKGLFGWTQEQQWEQELARADERYGAIFQKYASQDLQTLAKDPEAVQRGQRLYLNYCSTCHGSDAGGTRGFPDLSDEDWLYGSEPENIKASILHGRTGMMPPFGQILGDDGVDNVASYVRTLAGLKADAAAAKNGREQYVALCAGCHSPDGVGNKFLGAPNLTDNIWLYGSSPGAIKQTIRDGRSGVMPAHEAFLGHDKVHLLAAYIVSLSRARE